MTQDVRRRGRAGGGVGIPLDYPSCPAGKDGHSEAGQEPKFIRGALTGFPAAARSVSVRLFGFSPHAVRSAAFPPDRGPPSRLGLGAEPLDLAPPSSLLRGRAEEKRAELR